MSALHRHRAPLLGIGYLLVVAALVGSSVQTYRKEMPWQRTVEVTLETRRPGLELNPRSDVKLQGLRVGEVSRITSDGRGAVVHLALDPEHVDLVPADVDALIVPKTLFGEKYVDLVVPASSSGTPIAAGDVIRQSTTSTEIGDVYAKLVPLLRAVDPARLSTTLSSLATALDGRGRTLGDTMTLVNDLLGEVNPRLDVLQHDVRQFARTSQVYADAAPDLLRTMANSATISEELLVPAEERLADLLATVTQTAETGEEVLGENAGALVALAARARPVLEVLDTYSTTVPCVIDALRVANNVANQTAGSRSAYIYLTIDMMVRQQPYRYPDDLPSNPRSDAHPDNLPSVIPDWDPHCPEAAPWVEALGEAPPGSLSPLPNQAYPPERSNPRSGDRSSPPELPPYAGLLVGPMLADGAGGRR